MAKGSVLIRPSLSVALFEDVIRFPALGVKDPLVGKWEGSCKRATFKVV